MKDWSVLLIGVGVIGLLAWSGCQESRDQQAWRKDRDRQLTEVQAKQDSADRLLHYADSLLGYSNTQSGKADQKFRQAETSYRNARLLRDSIDRLLTASPDTSVSLHVALQAFDSLRVGYDSLRSAYDLQGQALASLDSAFWVQAKRAELYRESTDSLVALVHRVPTPKRFQLVGVVGYGAVLSGGMVRTGPSLSVGLRIPF